MKSLIIASGVLSALIMTGCATQSTMPKHEGEAKQHDGKYKKHHHKHGKMTKEYTCEANATIKAEYNPDDKKTILNITAPTLGLKAQDVALTHLKKDKKSKADTHQYDKKAHGFIFVNDTNADAKYQWQAVGSDGTLSVTTPTTTHTIKCQTQVPMHPHDKYHHTKPKGEMPKDAHHQHAM